MNTFWRTALIGCLLGGGLFACSEDRNEVDIEAAIAREAERRLEVFRTRMAQECYDSVLAEATRIADSLLLIRARQLRLAADRPPRPRRPGEPPEVGLSEALPLEPLFAEEEALWAYFDSLLRDTSYLDSLTLSDSLRRDSIWRDSLRLQRISPTTIMR
jgi:hypothetical protein